MTTYYFIDEKIEISKNIKGYFIGTNVNQDHRYDFISTDEQIICMTILSFGIYMK